VRYNGDGDDEELALVFHDIVPFDTRPYHTRRLVMVNMNGLYGDCSPYLEPNNYGTSNF